MPGIELSNLSGPELRRLLAAAEKREQQGLAERLRAELGARRGRDPMMAVAQGPRPTPAAPFEARFETGDDSVLGRLKAAALVIAAVAVVAMGIGWALGRAPNPPAAPRAEMAMAAQTAPPALATPAASPSVLASPAPPPPVPALPAVAKPQAPVAKQAKAVKAKAASRPAEVCRSNRVICSSPQLMAQERRLRRAYDEALAAGADPLAVDEAQARWRTTLAKTASRTGAAQLYDQRIRELEAAGHVASR
jgi:hypothetical protein